MATALPRNRTQCDIMFRIETAVLSVDYGIAAKIAWESRLLVTQRRWHAQNLISEFNISPSDTRLIIPILRRWEMWNGVVHRGITKYIELISDNIGY